MAAPKKYAKHLPNWNIWSGVEFPHSPRFWFPAMDSCRWIAWFNEHWYLFIGCGRARSSDTLNSLIHFNQLDIIVACKTSLTTYYYHIFSLSFNLSIRSTWYTGMSFAPPGRATGRARRGHQWPGSLASVSKGHGDGVMGMPLMSTFRSERVDVAALGWSFHLSLNSPIYDPYMNRSRGEPGHLMEHFMVGILDHWELRTNRSCFNVVFAEIWRSNGLKFWNTYHQRDKFEMRGV